MEHGACNVIYLDRRANDEYVRRDTSASSLAARASADTQTLSYFTPARATNAEVRENVNAILAFFNEVHVCNSGSTCLSKISELHRPDADCNPILVLIDMPFEDEERMKRLSREPRTPSPTSTRKSAPVAEPNEPDDIYGMHLLLHLASEIQQRTYSKLVVPVAVLSGFDQDISRDTLSPIPRSSSPPPLTDTVRLVKYLDAGAVDVYTSPLSPAHLHGLAVHAYRVYREVTKEESSFLMSKRNRKLSWVGVEEQKPYAYLREAMVSGLMSKICNPETVVETHNPSEVEVKPERKVLVEEAVGSWSFSAHDFSDDELLYASLLMLEHTLKMPELERWRLSTEHLTIFLLACRSAYNEFVLYHNFRHVADVLQALFYFLLQIGTIPPYPTKDDMPHAASPPIIASLLKPFDALTLLISAIGHDVGHPGVNNAFLVALNAPLAQLYNDRSVLESFHCAAYSQILRRFWPEAFADVVMRKLMINSILATDMGLHFKYMSDLGNFEEKLAHNKRTIDGWNTKTRDEYKDLMCGLLIKCADISNVARKFNTASRWAHILTDEFSNQGDMEQELQMPTCLFGGPPVLDSIVKMAESQINFMNIFARPLFEGVTNILPAMGFSVAEILSNKTVWESTMEKEKERLEKSQSRLGDNQRRLDVAPSPLSGSRENVNEQVDCPTDAETRGQGQEYPERRSDSFPFQDQEPLVNHDGSITGSSRPSSGSGPFQFTGPASSHRSSLGVVSASEKDASRQSSATGLPNSHNVTDLTHATKLAEKKATESPHTPPPRAISPSKNAASSSDDLNEEQRQRPTTAPSPSKSRYMPDEEQMANFPISSPRPMQPDFDSQIRQFHHTASEADLQQHMSNGTLDGSAPHSPRTWDPERRKRSDDSGVSPQDDSPSRWEQQRLRHRGSQRWKAHSWKRSTSANISEKVPNQDEKGGYLSAVTSNPSMTPIHERTRARFWPSKFWKKLKPNGERQHMETGEVEAHSPKSES